ncbi:ribosomal protein S18 acetylase RimI-like enzyme [Kineococcus radiotolerans]|uniref:Ribosomal protein S18 acetylase RimI-like enzyme n=1 Tax=Kineococcus radiotolerans TaxID=131568 RepID=A0A7W4TQL2_KINRA|nr:GNAT family N-acetyltransferase [Kineococcus radiotolerans]MBB2903145.1 ribosomal protein S18 acetylase RimI-like enzyme [Kineococcus radiotolerans]
MSELDDVLSNPVLSALHGPQQRFGAVRGRAARYAPRFAIFAGLPLEPRGEDWSDLAALCQPGETVIVVHLGTQPVQPPATWSLVRQFHGLQMEGTAVAAGDDLEIVELGSDHEQQMAELVARTQPGPWFAGTAQMGRYLGIVEQGQLVAMAGERMRVPGATEISAVCTDPAQRGRGLAGRLVQAVAAGIQARGERPVLHVSAGHSTAIGLYHRIGFTTTRAMSFDTVRLTG